MVKPFLSVIIPAYNEAKRLPLTLIDVDRHLSEQDFNYEIVVVVSPSSDKTAEIVQRFQAFIKNLKYIPLTENKGVGNAVRVGMRSAKGKFRLFMSADNSVAIVEFLKMQPYLTFRSAKPLIVADRPSPPAGGSLGTGVRLRTAADHHADHQNEAYDIVIGSRNIAGARQNPAPPIGRRFKKAIGAIAAKMTLLRGISDPTSGFQCYSDGTAEKIWNAAKVNGSGFNIEALALAQRFGFKIKEVPIFYSFDSGSRSRAGLGMLGDVFLTSWRLFTHGYKLK